MKSTLLFFVMVFGFITGVRAEMGLDGQERDKQWPSRFLVNGKIPDNVARAEIDEMISSVIGANKGAGLAKLEEGLGHLRELHFRMTRAQANERYLMKVAYFMVRQYTLVLSKRGRVDESEMVDQFLNLEAWYFRNSEAAKQMVKAFDKGLSVMREDIRKYSLNIYRMRKLEVAKEQFHEGYANLLSDSTNKVRGQAGQCGSVSAARSDCYACASYSIERSLRYGFKASDPWANSDINRRLNNPEYANQFHAGWNEETDRKVFRLTQIFSAKDKTSSEKQKAMQTALAAPKGSVLIWSICSGHPAGHIAIKTSDTVAASSFTAPIQQTCGNPNAQIVGVYAPVNNSKKIEAFKYEEPALENQGNIIQVNSNVDGTQDNEQKDSSPLGNFFSGLNF